MGLGRSTTARTQTRLGGNTRVRMSESGRNFTGTALDSLLLDNTTGEGGLGFRWYRRRTEHGLKAGFDLGVREVVWVPLLVGTQP